MGFTPCKAAQSLQGMQLQEKKKNLRVKRCVLILDLKPFWFVRGKSVHRLALCQM